MFRLLASALTLISFALPASADEPDAVLPEREALRGYWAPVRYEQGLTLTDDFGFGDFTADIDDELWVNRYGLGQLWVWKYSIDATAEPKQIDFEGRRQDRPDAPIERYVRLGIYKLEGDELTLCFSAVEPVRARHRPKDFSAKPGSGRIMTVFKRGIRPEQGEREQEPADESRSELRAPGPEARPSAAAPVEESTSPARSRPVFGVPGQVVPVPCEAEVPLP